jgi:hypothetical protein
MRAFLTSVVASAAIAIVAMLALDQVWQPADEAFTSKPTVRLPSHGNTHNLVGSDWYSAKNHGWENEILTSNSPSSITKP